MLKHAVFVCLALALFLGACGQQNPNPTTLIEPTRAAPTAGLTTSTSVPPTVTATTEPTDTQIPTKTSIPEPTKTPAPVSYGPNEYPQNVNPLTGLVVEDPALLDRRPVAIKVDVGLAYTRPPFGLSFADLIYSYYHNDGSSRFHAIYYGEDAEFVGSIRSGRMLDDLLVRMYKSFFVFGGADVIIRSLFINSNYTDRLLMEGNISVCPPTAKEPLCRFEPNVNSILLGGTEAIHDYFRQVGVSDNRQDLKGMFFHSTPPEGGKPADSLTTFYSQVDFNRWDYDRKAGTYLVYQDKVQELDKPEEYEPLIDRITEDQVQVENVVVLVVRDGYMQRPPSEIVEIYLNDGKGTAYAFRDGQVYEVVWNRPVVDSVLYLTDSDGNPFPFKPGSTWFSVVNEETRISQPSEGTWRFQYFIRP